MSHYFSHYFIGLPAWAFPGWTGTYFDNKPSALASYAQVFNTVEGNTTFYSMPDARTVDGWRSSLQGKQFKLCFKLPREATHDRHIDLNIVERFCRRIEPLGPNLGPMLLQFPAAIGPDQLNTIRSVMRALPETGCCVLEVRHPDFFRKPDSLYHLLQTHKAGLVVMDSRAIFHGNKRHPEVVSALHEKPNVPVWNQLFNGVLFVRLLLHPDVVSNDIYISQWVDRTIKALTNGHQVYMMIHCPNNQHCPAMAVQFHNLLCSKLDNIEPLRPWPVPQQSSLI